MFHLQKKIKEEDPDNKKYSKVRHHCHYIGKYRGSTHSSSNLRHSIPKCQYFFKMDQTMIIILSKKELAKELRKRV